MYVSEAHINLTEGYQLGDEGPYDAGDLTIGELFHNCRAEYGRCTGRVYIDSSSGKAHPIGWVFLKKRLYENAKGHYDGRYNLWYAESRPPLVYGPEDYYLHECWVTLYEIGRAHV